MDTQHHKIPPQGYLSLPEEDSTFPHAPSASNQYQNAQGTPLILQGIPVMSYPADNQAEPMRNFEVFQPNSVQLRELDSGWFSLYQVWLIICIIPQASVFFVGLLGKYEDKFHSAVPFFEVFYYSLNAWGIYIDARILSAVRQKNLKQIKRAIENFEDYLIPFGIFCIVQEIEVGLYPILTNSICGSEPWLCLGSSILDVTIKGLVVGVVIFGFTMFPAIKFRGLLIKAEEENNRNLIEQ